MFKNLWFEVIIIFIVELSNISRLFSRCLIGKKYFSWNSKWSWNFSYLFYNAYLNWNSRFSTIITNIFRDFVYGFTISKFLLSLNFILWYHSLFYYGFKVGWNWSCLLAFFKWIIVFLLFLLAFCRPHLACWTSYYSNWNFIDELYNLYICWDTNYWNYIIFNWL